MDSERLKLQLPKEETKLGDIWEVGVTSQAYRV